jgi:hypothetical protein
MPGAIVSIATESLGRNLSTGRAGDTEVDGRVHAASATSAIRAKSRDRLMASSNERGDSDAWEWRRVQREEPDDTSGRLAVTIGLTRVVRSTFLLTTLALLAAGCSSGTPSGPSDSRLGDTQNGRALGPSGLEQRIVTKVEAAPVGSPYTALLTATSTLVNTGSESVHLTARVCLFKDVDVETTARLDRFEPLISCAAESAEGDLGPGRSTELEVHFGVRSGPGTYTLKLRHSLTPDFRADASFRVP